MNHASVATPNASPAAHVAANSAEEANLCAYNSAFSDLGLRFRWDSETIDVLKQEFNTEIARITAYIERFHAHLLNAYEADFLAQLIFQKKTEFYREAAAD
ncbi:hypothetical protein [Paraburkholderia rhizosphaerae]|uniref:Uncharacterized protein n=1 Tax=Paraburkholderia rhizosphaerae TaxID=480658 RepID=A0A4R8LJR9_9BURK|nr:hypothetical protein [Paraburkholderia rhizosphaerae]TDY42535.1 hypothetical protein BX592_121106 [Paraburkholderia rhizosphaerae]